MSTLKVPFAYVKGTPELYKEFKYKKGYDSQYSFSYTLKISHPKVSLEYKNSYSIPLNFKYNHFPVNSYEFTYETYEKINKTENKLLYKSTDEIDKSCGILLYKENSAFDKGHSSFLYKETNKIDKYENKSCYKDESNIIKFDTKRLENHNRIVDKSNNSELSISDKIIELRCAKGVNQDSIITDKNKEMSLQNIDFTRNFDKSSDLEILRIQKHSINRVNSINLKTRDSSLDKNNRFELNIENHRELNKNYFIETERYVNEFIKEVSKNFIRDNTIKGINKFKLNSLERIKLYGLNKKVNSISFYKSKSVKKLDKDDSGSLLFRINNKNIDEIIEKHLYRNREKKLLKGNKSQLIYKVYKAISKDSSIAAMDRTDIKDLFKSITNMFYKQTIYKINRSVEQYLDTITIKNINKINYKCLDKATLKHIFNGYSSRVFSKEAIRSYNLNNYNFLETYPKEIFISEKSKELNKYSLIIYNPLMIKKMSKESVNINLDKLIGLNKYTININLDMLKMLNKKPVNIYNPYKTEFLELVKRWWWIKPTEPTDKLIIPNVDYDYNSEQLSNGSLEYLRNGTDHPLYLGDTWGIDYEHNPVSIEIMTELVNIIIMIWHHNVQGFMNCTGKEAMQFIIELLYDWYNLDTSYPNYDYYRTYRWIRWEAEKVYFLAKEDSSFSGIKYIGILVANLIDYLKVHHFDVVPIWKVPGKMDSMRINEQQGDLIKDLDKKKGKRFYLLNTQNIEKNNRR